MKNRRWGRYVSPLKTLWEQVGTRKKGRKVDTQYGVQYEKKVQKKKAKLNQNLKLEVYKPTPWK